MWALLWNFDHLQVLLFRFMMVPEGYIGSETPVCFVLTKRSRQICIPEPVTVRSYGQGVSLMLSCEGIMLWSSTGDIFRAAWVSKKFVVSQRSMCVPRGSPTGSEVIIIGFWQDLKWCLHRQIIQLSKWLLWSAWSLPRVRCWNKQSTVSLLCVFS